MKSSLLDTLPVAMLVAAEAFVTGFAAIWATFSLIGLEALAVPLGLGAATLAMGAAGVGIFYLAGRATPETGDLVSAAADD